jgi:Ca2+/Na+ antiporter
MRRDTLISLLVIITMIGLLLLGNIYVWQW